ncbi:MAG: DUF192 domain-containing protein [Algisphaera sp.]
MAARSLLIFAARFLHLAGCTTLVFASLLTTAGCSTESSGTLPIETFHLNGMPLTTELALTQDHRFRGLSGRESLPVNRGMLFVFQNEAPRSFVMRDCLMPIDIAFIDASGHVVNVHRMTLDPPGTPEHKLTLYKSNRPALMALELAAGGLDRYGLKPGVKTAFPLLKLKRRAR